MMYATLIGETVILFLNAFFVLYHCSSVVFTHAIWYWYDNSESGLNIFINYVSLN